jgi:hypothetical protein
MTHLELIFTLATRTGRKHYYVRFRPCSLIPEEFALATLSRSSTVPKKTSDRSRLVVF